MAELIMSPNLRRSPKLRSRIPEPPAAGGYLVEEDFSASGYDHTLGVDVFEESTGTFEPSYATSPAPLDGTHSLRLTALNQQPRVYWTFSATGDVWAYLMVHPVSYGAGRVIASIADSAGNVLATVEWRSSDDKWLLRSGGGTTKVTGTAFPIGSTTYHVWLHYTKGTGANGFASLGVSTDGTEPTSGGGYVELTNSTRTVDAARVYAGQGTGNGTFELIVDKVRVKGSAIGSNPA